jgi:integrase
MSPVSQKFTDISIEKLPIPQQGRAIYWDKPLGIRVTPKGTKSYIVALGSGERKVIARVGAISLKDARQAALRLKGEYDPKKYKAECVSVAEARTAYLAAITVRPRTRKYYETYLAKLPNIPRQDVDHRHILRILDQAPRGSAGLHVRTYSAFFRWCIPRWLKFSPCTGLKTPKSVARSRVLTDEELRAIYETALSDGGTFSKIVMLLMITGLRRTECSLIERSWIQNTTLTIPETITKNHGSHSLPLGPLAVHTISSITGDSRFVFSANNNQAFTSWSEAKAALDGGSGVTGWVLHDLRRSYASNHARIGTPIHIIERLLNHVTGSISGVAAIYNRHSYADECRTAQEKYEQFFVEKILGQPCSNH